MALLHGLLGLWHLESFRRNLICCFFSLYRFCKQGCDALFCWRKTRCIARNMTKMADLENSILAGLPCFPFSMKCLLSRLEESLLKVCVLVSPLCNAREWRSSAFSLLTVVPFSLFVFFRFLCLFLLVFFNRFTSFS